MQLLEPFMKLEVIITTQSQGIINIGDSLSKSVTLSQSKHARWHMARIINHVLVMEEFDSRY